MISRRNFLASMSAVGAVGATGALAAEAQQDRAQQRPNVLIFMPDQQLGATILPDHPCLTPNMDRFAKEGLLFSNAFCPAPHCCPSRASFMTGMYPSEHGVFNNVDTDTAIHADPNPGMRYFSQGLKDAGYNLGYSGKWHVGRTLQPEHVGWTSLNAPAARVSHLGEDHRSAHWKDAHAEMGASGQRALGEVIRPGWGNTQLFGVAKLPFEKLKDYRIVQDGIAGLQAYAKQPEPWCVMISNDGGHDVYDPPQQFLDLYDWRKIQLPENFRDRMQDKPRIYQRMRLEYWDQLFDDEVKMCIAHYYALLSMQDHLFGQILKALEDTGQAENTLVIYCSDHGDYAGAHGLWAKGVPAFREGYNIPCAIRWPKRIKNTGRILNDFVSTTDFAPTILDAAGVKSWPMSGSSLTPWFDNLRVEGWRDAIFMQLNGTELYYTQRIVMTKTHKYVYNGFDFDELYDLTADPHEMRNLAYSAEPRTAPVTRASGAWPELPRSLDAVRRDLLTKMWQFARDHNDQIFNNYITVAMAPYGPGITNVKS